MEVYRLILGTLLILCGLALLGLKLLVGFGRLRAPSGGMFVRGEDGSGATAWDFLLALLEKTGWAIPVGIVLVVLGAVLAGAELSSLRFRSI